MLNFVDSAGNFDEPKYLNGQNFNVLVFYDYYKRFSLESLSFPPIYINLKSNINIKLKSSLSFFLKSTKILICWFVDVLICCFVDLLIFVDFQQISTINKRFSETSQQKSTINKQKNFDFQPCSELYSIDFT